MVGHGAWPALNGLHLETGTAVVCTLPAAQVGPGFDKRLGKVTACSLSMGRYSYELLLYPQRGAPAVKVAGVSPHEIMPTKLGRDIGPVPIAAKPSVARVVQSGELPEPKLSVRQVASASGRSTRSASSAASPQKATPVLAAAGIVKHATPAASATKSADATSKTPPPRPASTRQNSNGACSPVKSAKVALAGSSEGAKSNSSELISQTSPPASPQKLKGTPAVSTPHHRTRSSQNDGDAQAAGACLNEASVIIAAPLPESTSAVGSKRQRSTPSNPSPQSDGERETSGVKRNKLGHELCCHNVRPQFCKKCLKSAKSNDRDANSSERAKSNASKKSAKSNADAAESSQNASKKSAKSNANAAESSQIVSSQIVSSAMAGSSSPNPSREQRLQNRNSCSSEGAKSDKSAMSSNSAKSGKRSLSNAVDAHSSPAGGAQNSLATIATSQTKKKGKSAGKSAKSQEILQKEIAVTTGISYGRAPSGHELCEHQVRKTLCKACKGGGICEHDRQRSWCRECGGKARCEHGKQKSKCRLCGGSAFCTHGKYRYRCDRCKNKKKK